MHVFYFSKKKIKKFFALFLIIVGIFLLLYQFLGNYQMIPAFTYNDNRFLNKTIVIDPGHGGIDVGVIDSKGLMEKDINFKIAKFLKKLLEESGANCIITRDKDTDLSYLSNQGKTRQLQDLNARVNLINQSQADFFVSIHVNSFPKDHRIKGPMVFYYPQSKSSKNLAEVIQNRLNIEYNNIYKEEQYNKAKGESFYILKNTDCPGVIVEVGFMSNEEDYKLLNKAKFKNFIAYQIYIALGEYLHQ